MIAAGVFLGVLVGASTLYIYLASKDSVKPRKQKKQRKLSTDSSSEETPKSTDEQLQEDMKVIGSINLDHFGNLSFSDFCRLYTLIKKHVQPRLQTSLANYKKERRAALENCEL